MLILIYACLLSSILLVAGSFLQIRPRVSLYPHLKKEIEDEAWLKDELLLKPFLITRPFLAFNRLILNKFGRQNLTNRLFLGEINCLPEDFLGIKELLILGLVLFVFLLFKKFEPLWLSTAVLAGFFLPELHLNRRIQKRKRLIVKTLPDAIDLLNLCVGGGLDFVIGLNWVVRRSRQDKNPLVKEFSILIHELKIGKPRHQALKDMGKRLQIPEVFTFVNTLVHADRMGTAISDILDVLSDEARRQRFQRGERLALQAPIKMLFPLVIFILPVVGIIVGGPILLQFLQGGLPKF